MAENKTSTGGAKARFFAAVTYRTDTEGLVKVLQSKGNSLRAYALIKHDKDEADAHHHMVLRTHSTWTCPQVAKWFANESGQNTFVQVVRDRTGIVEYLTHENEPDKHHYDKGDIIDGGLDEILPAGECSDDTFEIVEKMLAGYSIRELVRLYGRDFVYHYSSYAAICAAIKGQEE